MATETRTAGAPRILLLKLGAIGDVVYTLPLLHRLRRGMPDAYIAWVVEPRAHALLADHPLLDDVIVYDRRRPLRALPPLVRRLRLGRFDIALDLQRIAKSGLLAALSGAPVRYGFDRGRSKEGAHLFATTRLPPLNESRHMVHQYLEFADAMGIAPCEVAFPLPPGFQLPVGHAEVDVVLGIGAGKPANRWPDTSWSALAQRLLSAGLGVALSGSGATELRLARRIQERCDGTLVDQVGRLTLPETAALIRASRLYVGLDSGITHLAAALGHPVVALYGPADPRRTGPWGPRARVVRLTLPCAPCGERHCPLSTGACLRDLSPAEVAEAVVASLPDRPAAPRAAPIASRT